MSAKVFFVWFASSVTSSWICSLAVTFGILSIKSGLMSGRQGLLFICFRRGL